MERLEGLRRFLEEYAELRRKPDTDGLASRLAEFFRKAAPLSATERPTGPAISPIPAISPQRLGALLTALRDPLQEAREMGDFLQVWAVAGLKRNEIRNAAVLAWLLNPRGSHGCGPGILQGFLAMASGMAPGWPTSISEVGDARVSIEERPLGSDRDRVDIAIDGPDFCLLVEVKIDAPEGRAQLSRYVEAARVKAHALRKPHALVAYISPLPPSAPHPDVAVLTWRHVARVLSESRAPGMSGALIRQFARHIRDFF